MARNDQDIEVLTCNAVKDLRAALYRAGFRAREDILLDVQHRERQEFLGFPLTGRANEPP